MKFYWVMIFCFMGFSSFGHASERMEKFRIASDMIEMMDGKIFVHISGIGVFTVNAIFSDGDGLYVEGFNPFNLWKCSYCDKYNHNDWNVCQWCGMPRN